MQTKAALGRLAKAVRAETGCAPDEPFDPWKWASDNGIPFLSLDEIAGCTAARNHFVVERPEVWSALLTRYGMQHVVIYNPAHAPQRIRSNLTHEVAHFAAEHQLSDAWMDDEGHCGAASTGQENEAAELAGALLIPADIARRHAIAGGSAEALAVKYQVSAAMARWRIGLSGGPTIARRSRNKHRR
jgi:Zn-dependent peptidase ImmA (M78 family)